MTMSTALPPALNPIIFSIEGTFFHKSEVTRFCAFSQVKVRKNTSNYGHYGLYGPKFQVIGQIELVTFSKSARLIYEASQHQILAKSKVLDTCTAPNAIHQHLHFDVRNLPLPCCQQPFKYRSIQSNGLP